MEGNGSCVSASSDCLYAFAYQIATIIIGYRQSDVCFIAKRKIFANEIAVGQVMARSFLVKRQILPTRCSQREGPVVILAKPQIPTAKQAMAMDASILAKRKFQPGNASDNIKGSRNGCFKKAAQIPPAAANIMIHNETLCIATARIDRASWVASGSGLMACIRRSRCSTAILPSI